MEGRKKEETDSIHVAQDMADSDRRSFARYSVRGLWRVHDRAAQPRHRRGVRHRPRRPAHGNADPLPPARRYALSIEVCFEAVERPRIEVIARCAWHRARPDLQFETGFEFVEMTPQTRGRIAQYIDELAV